MFLRNLLFVILVMLCFNVWGGNVGTALSFDVRSHDYGAILESQGRKSCVFYARNVSEEVVSVLRVRSGCPCVGVTMSENVIAPGQTIKFVVSYDPVRQKGHFTKKIKISTSIGIYYIMVTGIVVDDVPKIHDRFPIEIGRGIMVKSDKISAGTLTVGEEHIVGIPVGNDWEITQCVGLKVAVTGSGVYDGDILSIDCGQPVNVGPESEGELKIRIRLKKKVSGRARIRFTFTADGETLPGEISLTLP